METNNALVLRIDFSDDASWEALCAAIREPVGVKAYVDVGESKAHVDVGEFKAYVDFVSDPEYNGMMVEELLSLVPPISNHWFFFIVDQLALSHPEHPILVVDLGTEPGRTFRVIPSEMWAVENNLSIANMDFAEFADSTDQDGIFRGFPRS